MDGAAAAASTAFAAGWTSPRRSFACQEVATASGAFVCPALAPRRTRRGARGSRCSARHLTCTSAQQPPTPHHDRPGEAPDDSRNGAPPIYLSDLDEVAYQELSERPERFGVTGAYAIFDMRRTLRYIGYSKDVGAKLRYHGALMRDACHFFKLYRPNADGANPAHLEGVLDLWIVQNDRVPSGNAADRVLWEAPDPRTRPPEVPRSAALTKRPPTSSAHRRRDDRRRAVDDDEMDVDDTDAFDDDGGFEDDSVDDAEFSYRGRRGRTERQSAARRTPRAERYGRQREYDPFDPFSASSRGRDTARSTLLDRIVFSETWYPVLLIGGAAVFLWTWNLMMVGTRTIG